METNRTRPGELPGEWSRHRTRRVRTTLLALTAAGGLLLTGCAAGGGGSNSSNSDTSNRTGFPAPAPPVASGGEQNGGQSADQDGEQTGTPADKIAPSPD